MGHNYSYSENEKEWEKVKDKMNKNKKQNIRDVNTEQNAIYSDPKDAANMQTVPQPKDFDEIEY